MKHLFIALGEYGQKEVVGEKHNKRIVDYSTEIGNTWVKTDEVAWCSEFVNWCLLKAGIMGTRSAVARSFLTWGQETKTPKLGDIVIFNRPPDPKAGHIGFYIREDGDKIWTLGGNQNDAVNISAYPKSRVISYRRVLSVEELQEEIKRLKEKLKNG